MASCFFNLYFQRSIILLCGLLLMSNTVMANNFKTLLALGQQYEHGEGIPKDYAKALEYYCLAAQGGSADGLYALGWMYANGRGVTRDDKIAAALLTRAASKEHPGAQKMLTYLPPPVKKSNTALSGCVASSSASINYVDKQQDTYSAGQQPVISLVYKLAPEYQVDPDLVLAIISVESAFNSRAVSSKNAQGLMQLIPATAQRFQVKDSFDPEENIKGGLAYLRWLLAYFKGNVAWVAAAYNAGEGAVEKYRGIPPYPETVNYVDKILQRYQKAVHPYQPEIINRSSFIFTSAEQRN